MKLNKNIIFGTILIFGLITNLSVIFNIQFIYLRAITSFIYLTTIPGLLINQIIKIKKLNNWEHLLYSVGLSVGFLMFTGLLANWLLPLYGIYNPLSINPLIIFINALIFCFYVIAYFRSASNTNKINFPKFTIKNTFLILTPLSFPLLSILGAISLNNSGSNLFTMMMLLGVVIYSIFLVVVKKINKNVYPWAIYICGLSLLFMTSMRGWYATGHDIQQEYYVFSQTRNSMHWSMNLFQDAYNACLSINILPTIYLAFSNINDIYVFKILFQIIFAIVPVGVYFLLKKYARKVIAFLSAFIFITFPTFSQDMPMLNRQEIAFLFFVLTLLTLFKCEISKGAKQLLFIFLGFCMIVSHYSTSFIAVTLFMGVYMISAIYRNINILNKFKIGNRKFYLSFVMVSSLTFFTIFWNSQVDQKKYGLLKIVKESATAMFQSFNNDQKSSDLSYSILSWNKLDREKIFKNYVKNIESGIEASENRDSFYTREEYEKPKISLKDELVLPLSTLGMALKNFSLDPFTIHNIYKQLTPKLIQLILIIGFAVILLNKSKHVKNIDTEYSLLLGVGIVLLAVFTVVPVLSLGYGAFRLFYQLLILASLPLIVGFFRILFFVRGRQLIYATFIFFAVFFLSFSGFLPQLTGGFYPLIALSNSGLRYDCMYIHESEIKSLKWFVSNDSGESRIRAIQSNECTYFKLVNITGKFTEEGNVIPAAIRKNSYVYLDYSNIKTGNNVIRIKGSPYIYNIPFDFLNENKNLIYNNNETKIYR